jgi:hypothetical protein
MEKTTKEEDLKITDSELNLEIKREQLRSLKHSNNFREEYGVVLFGITVIWILIMLIIVILHSFKLLHLPDSVLITFISTTTVNVLAFFVLVVKYFFSPGKSD